MKALTIKQPWASLIAHGIKDIENRTWKTNFRGPIFIHAAAKEDVFYKGKELAFTPEQWATIPKNFSAKENRDKIFISSAIIGEVDIVDCVINHGSIWAEETFIPIDDSEGYPQKPIYNWVLANPVLYDKPILNVKGRLSFWEPDLTVCNHCLEWVPELEDGFGCKDCAGKYK